MSNALIFDTHRFVKELTQAGMPEQQAEVISFNQRDLIENHIASKRDLKELEVALKHDIKELEIALKQDIKELEVNIKELEVTLKNDMKELEARMTLRLGSMMVISIGAVATLVKLL